MTWIKLNTLENIETAMPKYAELLATSKDLAVGPPLIAQLAEALATIARELREVKYRIP